MDEQRYKCECHECTQARWKMSTEYRWHGCSVGQSPLVSNATIPFSGAESSQLQTTFTIPQNSGGGQ